MLHLLRALTASQHSAVVANYLDWTVDAFDFFISSSSYRHRDRIRHPESAGSPSK
jgi:hypothetical protein